MIPENDIHEATKEKNQESIDKWIDYYKKQLVIGVSVPGDKDFEEKYNECEDSIDLSDIAFIISLPLTFMHLHDFKNNLSSAIIYFWFTKNGEVYAPDKTCLPAMNYEEAYKEIIRRVNGNDFVIVPEIPEKDLLTQEEDSSYKEKLAQFNERIDNWLALFKALPIVEQAYRCTPKNSDDADTLLEVVVTAAYGRGDNAGSYSFCLETRNTYREFDMFAHEEVSTIFEKWLEKRKDTESTWTKLYEELVDLSNQCLAVEEAPKS